MLQYSARLKFQNLLYVNFNKKANNISFQRNIFFIASRQWNEKNKMYEEKKKHSQKQEKKKSKLTRDSLILHQ